MAKLAQKRPFNRQIHVKPYEKKVENAPVVTIDDDVEGMFLGLLVKIYPTTVEEREKYISSKTNKCVTPFQFRVYDLCAQIPKGYISTYKLISDALKASPRAVGQALRNNPFAPLPVPCHRVVASNFFIGGFDGQWGSGNNICNKKAKLAKEGIGFDENDKLAESFTMTKVFSDFKI